MFCTAVATSRRGATRAHLVLAEGVDAFAREAQHPDRARSEQERCDELAAQTEAEEQLVRMELPLFEVAPDDDLTVEHSLQHRAPDRIAVAGRKDLALAAPGSRHRRRRVAFDQDDRRPLEGDEPAQLADERAERFVELERGAERPRTAVRCLEHVDPVSELVAEALRLGGTRLGPAPLRVERVPELSDHDAGEHPDEDPDERRSPLDSGPSASITIVEPVITAPATTPPTSPRRRAASAIGIR